MGILAWFRRRWMWGALLAALAVLAFGGPIALADEATAPSAGASPELTLKVPPLVHRDVPFAAEIAATAPLGGTGERVSFVVRDAAGDAPIAGGKGELARADETGVAHTTWTIEGLTLEASGSATLVLEVGGGSAPASADTHSIPGWLSIVPPLLAILLAVVFRQVLVALFMGVAAGAFIAHGYDPLAALLRPVDTYGRDALADPDHASVILFSLLLGGLVALISRSGGAAGMAQLVTRWATTPRRGQVGTWVLGMLIFFDDYANALLVGPTMRPITDRLRVSREKLSFIVDATAAPVASLAFISSWIGVEVGSIAEQLTALNLEGDAYILFLETIPYRFYSILMLAFVLLVAVTGRDFGPMRRAELRAHAGEVSSKTARPVADFEDVNVAPIEGRTQHWVNAVAPIGAAVATCLVGMVVTGRQATIDAGKEVTLRNIFGNASSYQALVWCAFVGTLVAVALVLAQRRMKLEEIIDTWLAGLKSLMLAMLILILAWSLATICRELQTAVFLTGIISGQIPVGLLPAAVFVVAAIVSFATGTSWGTMGILFPLVMPLAHHMAPGDPALMLGAVSSILTGSVWGDHCSPISDTTIMSSMATGCDHIDHIRTQLPYALVVGIVALLVGDVATGLGLYGGWVGLGLGLAVVVGIVFVVGRPVGDQEPKRTTKTEQGA